MEHKNRLLSIAMFLLCILLMTGGTWLKKPQPKPEPPQPPQQAEPAPPQVDFGKYKSEPTISVYMAETGKNDPCPLSSI